MIYSPTVLVQYTQGEFTSHGLAISLAYAVYLSGEEMCLLLVQIISTLGYNEFDFFLENEEYRPFDGCKIEI
jgi:hypothetical protein